MSAYGGHQATFPVATMCRVLGVSESGYYAWQHRAPSRHARRDAELRVAIRASHARSDATYGAPRVRADLAEAGHHVGCKRVARLTHDRPVTVLCCAPTA